jgi:hypothetical protein
MPDSCARCSSWVSSQASNGSQRHFDDLGQRSTIDIRRDYLDDTRVDSVRRANSATPVPRRGLGSLISALFRRRKR